MIIAFDDSPADLVRLCDQLQLAALQRRYEIAERGHRNSRLRTLRRAVLEQLQRTQQEKPQ